MDALSPAKTFIVKCPLCSAEKSTGLFMFGTLLFPINISMCNHCGFVFQNPRVSEQDWCDYYEKGLYDKFHRPRAVTDSRSISPEGVITYQRIRNFILRPSNLSHFLVADLDKMTRDIKICEVGAGNGDVITCFRGADLFAVEPSQNCRETLKRKGVVVLGESINSAEANVPATFDIILMRHVLEHVYFPSKLLRDIFPRLSDNGIFYIAVPNVLRPAFLGNFTYPHISHFSKYSLTYLFEREGFEIWKIQEDADEIWCIVKKIRKSGEESSQGNESLFDVNIGATKRCFKAYMNPALFVKRSLMRIISCMIPSALLVSIYARRCKGIVR